MMNLDVIRAAPVTREPFSYFLATNVLGDADLDLIKPDFPAISTTGVFPLDALKCGPHFERLIDEISSRDIEGILEQKLEVALRERPLMITVRGFCHPRDGSIHTDSKDKVITCLLYLNDKSWESATGRLRFLRDGSDIGSTLAEAPPTGGTLVAFKRSDCSWHGHTSFEGPRRYVMFNWVTSPATLAKNIGRHKLSARVKSLNPFNRK
jgi:SM-20-related protein